MYQADSINVLMFGWELPPHNSGGLGVACLGLARGLSQQGVRISFAMPRRLPSRVPFMKILHHDLQGGSVTAINSLLEAYMTKSEYFSYASKLRQEQMGYFGGSLYDEAKRFGEMAASWSKRLPHKVIHAHDWMTYPAGMRAKNISGKSFVAHVHATEYDRTGGNVDSPIAEIEYQGLNQADRVIAVSNYTKGIVHDYYGVPNEKIVVVHNGIDMNEFCPADIRKIFPKDKVVLFVGRLTLQKGTDYFLRAAWRVLATRPNTIFLVVGSGDMEHKLIMQAASMGIAEKVIFTGFMSGEKLRACYALADAFVMPSVSEPYGIVALEAIAAGVPAIISKQSGVSETLSSVVQVDFWDTDEMADQILEILDKPKMAAKMVQKAREEVADMTWEKAAYKTVKVYRDLI